MSLYFSVVVCSYNREKYIAEAIESLLHQSLEPHLFEILIIDNNSTDQTAKIAKRYVEQYADSHQIRYIKETNQGLCFARNRGISEARGKFIVYIDDDGIADCDFLSVQYHFLNENAAAIGLGGKIIPRYVDGKPGWIDGILEGLVSKVDHGESVFQYSGKKYPVGCNMTYRKDVLVQIGMFDTAVGQVGDNLVRGDETELYQRVKKLNLPVFYLPKSRVEHVIEKSRLTRDHIRKMSEGVGRGRRILFNKADGMGRFKIRMELLLKFLGALVFAIGYFFTGRFSKAAAWIRFRIDVNRGFSN